MSCLNPSEIKAPIMLKIMVVLNQNCPTLSSSLVFFARAFPKGIPRTKIKIAKTHLKISIINLLIFSPFYSFLSNPNKLFIHVPFKIEMDYKNFLIVASKLDKAGIGMTTQLSQFGNYNFYLLEKDIIHTENLDLHKIKQYDFIIFASKHKGTPSNEGGTKTLSVHAPGNWRSADFGGLPGKACPASAVFMKQIFEKIDENMKSYNMKDYKLTMETTHHGPLIDKPCVFIEIGPGEPEWGDRRAAFLMAKSIHETIKGYKENPYNEIAIAIGGPHYCPSFNKIQLSSNVAISHVISQYAFPVTEEMIIEAVGKTEEEVDFVLLDWKGMGGAEERDKVIEMLNRLYLRYKKTSEVGK